MKRALLILLVVLVALLVLAYQPPHLVQELESQAVAGDWQAALALSDFYGSDRIDQWSSFTRATVPPALRARRYFQRSESRSEFWESRATNLMYRAAEKDDPDALFIVAAFPPDDAPAWLSEERRNEYLVRSLLDPQIDPERHEYLAHVLHQRNPEFVSSLERQAAREGLLWPTLLEASDAMAVGDYDRWLSAWSDALSADLPGARAEWARLHARLLAQDAAGNGSATALLDRIRAFDRSNPSAGLLDA